jgi:hypothetical protein
MIEANEFDRMASPWKLIGLDALRASHIRDSEETV